MNWWVGPIAQFAVVLVYASYFELNSIRSEVRNGMYNPGPYLASMMLLQCIMMLLMAASISYVPIFAMMSYPTSKIVHITLVYAIYLLSFDSTARLMSHQKFMLKGMMDLITIWFNSFLFSGVFIRSSDIRWPFRMLSYVLPMGHTMKILAFYTIGQLEFGGAEICDPNMSWACRGGYQCLPGVLVCYGRTGAQVLTTLNSERDLFEAEFDVREYLLYIWIFVVAVSLCLVGQFVQSCQLAIELQDPKRSKSPLQPLGAWST